METKVGITTLYTPFRAHDNTIRAKKKIAIYRQILLLRNGVPLPTLPSVGLYPFSKSLIKDQLHV